MFFRIDSDQANPDISYGADFIATVGIKDGKWSFFSFLRTKIIEVKKLNEKIQPWLAH